MNYERPGMSRETIRSDDINEIVGRLDAMEHYVIETHKMMKLVYIWAIICIVLAASSSVFSIVAIIRAVSLLASLF